MFRNFSRSAALFLGGVGRAFEDSEPPDQSITYLHGRGWYPALGMIL
jgi:hypothetical protein